MCIYEWTNHILGIGLVVLSLDLQIGDSRIEFQVGKVDKNLFRDLGMTAN